VNAVILGFKIKSCGIISKTIMISSSGVQFYHEGKLGLGSANAQ